MLLVTWKFRRMETNPSSEGFKLVPSSENAPLSSLLVTKKERKRMNLTEDGGQNPVTSCNPSDVAKNKGLKTLIPNYTRHLIVAPPGVSRLEGIKDPLLTTLEDVFWTLPSLCSKNFLL